VPAFVICIGNAVVGGVGKTPFAIAIAKLFLARGKKVVFVSRGYGGYAKGVVCVDDNTPVEMIGDEAKLLSRIAPTVVGRDRYAACMRASDLGAEVIVMDDGLQNNSVVKDCAVLLVDGKNPYGNGFMFPAGPLREPFWWARRKADMLVSIGDSMRDAHEIFRYGLQPDLFGVVQPVHDMAVGDPEVQYHAFCSIARPERFVGMLARHGYSIAQTTFFSDHYRYTKRDLDILMQSPYQLITTAKDAVKMPSALLSRVKVFEIETVLDITTHNLANDTFLSTLLPM
jgi:tetraacyldisaccharide 4'-kinase